MHLTPLKPSVAFQSTPSVGRATRTTKARLWIRTFQSTPSVGRATVFSLSRFQFAYISIHALRGEGDVMTCEEKTKVCYISIHALRGEGDTRMTSQEQKDEIISIHALRGEGDLPYPALLPGTSHFNPRPPWGGRRRSL